ncbi:hypothetical protein J4Q44_G00356200 [Coregonus suidteri]|uniref:Uncharacterized protein n=1 Tax=Coregonus suidteri TaxID=861788 RepID=A0AAN8KZC9_9TELE
MPRSSGIKRNITRVQQKQWIPMQKILDSCTTQFMSPRLMLSDGVGNPREPHLFTANRGMSQACNLLFYPLWTKEMSGKNGLLEPLWDLM